MPRLTNARRDAAKWCPDGLTELINALQDTISVGELRCDEEKPLDVPDDKHSQQCNRSDLSIAIITATFNRSDPNRLNQAIFLSL